MHIADQVMQLIQNKGSPNMLCSSMTAMASGLLIEAINSDVVVVVHHPSQ